MSYRNPAVLQDTGALKAKANALQGVQKEIDKPFKPEEKKKEEEDEKPCNSNKPVESQNQPFVKPTSKLQTPPTTTSQTVPGAGTEVPNIDQSQSAFYKSGGPINDPDFYKGFGTSDDTNDSIWIGGQEDPKLKGL